MRARKTSNIALAVAAAGMFAFAPMVVNAADNANVKCYGINSCKGQNDCKTAFNECKGHGSCKGMGFKEVSMEKCTEMGGSLESKRKS